MGSIYVDNLLVTVGFFILLSWACYLPLRAGQLYNGPVFAAALSGYTAAYTTKVLGWPPAAGLLGGIVVAAAVAFVLSFVLAPLSMFQMAVITIALIFIVQTTLRNVDAVGGVTGMSGVPGLPGLVPICLVAVLLGLVLLTRLARSRWGRAMEAAEVDREMAMAMGVDVIRMSRALQTLGGALGGLAGAIYTFNLGTVHPEIFGFGQLLYCFTIVIVGGRHTPWGMLIFGPILWLIPEFFPGAIAAFRNIAFGAIVVLFLLAMPKGVITRRVVTIVERALGGRPAPRTVPRPAGPRGGDT